MVSLLRQITGMKTLELQAMNLKSSTPGILQRLSSARVIQTVMLSGQSKMKQEKFCILRNLPVDIRNLKAARAT